MAELTPLPADTPPPPSWSDNEPLETLLEREAQWTEKLAERARAQCEAPEAGTWLKFPVADSYAQYLVWQTEPLTLMHLPLGDAWEIPDAHVRGLVIDDVRQQLEQEKALRQILRAPKAPGPSR